MIRYDLTCAEGHAFDGWFRDSATFEAQVESGALSCPHCGSVRVSKQIMAPAVSGSKKQVAAKAAVAMANAQAARDSDMLAAMRRLRDHVRANADYVGKRFAEEARRIHYKECEPRGIYGEATVEEASSLIEEGVSVAPLPVLPEDKN